MTPATTRRTLLAALPGLALAAPALGQAWPARQVRLVLPFAAGGAADVVIRIVAAHMAESSGQAFVVQNITGGSGNIGTEQVARAAPDGTTFLVGSPGTLAINPHMFRNLSFSVERDFVPMAHVATFPQVLVVNPRVPVQTTEELIALARARPGQLNYGSGGNGSTGHLITAMFLHQAGVEVVHVPFRGGAPAAQALVTGDVQFVIDGLPTWLSYMGTPQIRILGITSAQRWPALPDVPAIGERAVPGFDLGSWVVLAAPTGTPAEVGERLAELVNRAVANDEVRRRLAAAGALPAGGTPEHARRFQRAELEKWGRVVQVSGARVD
ncbi:Bug family tripartite tricarboxylate transporter substrate binding protein [Falsiroseomonas oryzae]|uniref:Bug family tripartite tricarboxylate transporter substrate binding protein n=1 Tax=Falsiroseomonas oryzae TaxID=2766473 RepID=UPI0022EB1E8C|nr:tripartite tricarboxylate transporter substrate binding protein [Roseomonas sp. MO-31]